MTSKVLHRHAHNLSGHFAERAVGKDQFVGVDYCFELRDQNAVARLIVGYSDHPIARRLWDRCVDEVRRQAVSVCINRHTHFGFPPHVTHDEHGTASFSTQSDSTSASFISNHNFACVAFAQRNPTTIHSAASSYQFVGRSSSDEAPTAASFAPSQAVVVGAAIQGDAA